MGKVWVLLSMLVSGCGRIAFDVVSATHDGTTGDSVDGDSMMGDGPPAVSCGTLAPTCGPTGTSPCCESPVVTGGMFYRSYDGVDYNDKGYPATVSTFRLDKYEVTVGRFRQFVDAGMGTQQNPPPSGAGGRTLNGMANQGGWDPSWNVYLAADTMALVSAIKCESTYQTWTDTPGGNENRPMNCITWYEAMAFCIWDGGFLPTEAEWNYAAAGGSEQRAYPWSSPAFSLTLDDSTYASYYVDTTKQCMGDGVMGCALTDVVPVGTKPAGDGRWGQSDLSGNVWEWVLDWFASPYPTSACDDCANLISATYRLLRGGCFHDGAILMRVGHRDLAPPDNRFDHVGLRCARAP